MANQKLTLSLILAFSVPGLAHAQSGPTRVSGSTTPEAGFAMAGKDGAEWLLPGGPRIRASAGAKVRILHTPQPLTLGPGVSKPGYTVVLKDGRIDIEIPDTAKSAVVLSASRKTTAIIASGHAAARNAGAMSAIASYGGATSVSLDGDAFRPLAAGEVGVVDGTKKETRALIAPPSAIYGGRVLVAFTGAARFSNLSWTAPANAAGYRLTLANDATPAETQRIETATPSVQSPFEALEPGAYTIALESVDPTGLESGSALRAPVRVLGATLPEGAYIDGDGVLRMAPAQRVKLTSSQGIEVAYNNRGRWLKGTQSMAMLRGEPTQVLFRLPGTSDVASARIAPRTERADISLGPSTATWPKDPVEIRIRLSNQGRHSAITMHPKVSVGIEQVPVSFTRDGEWLKASLKPRSGKGPWVVRVEVADQFGMPLGRDFLEITQKKAPSSATVTAPARGKKRISRAH